MAKDSTKYVHNDSKAVGTVEWDGERGLFTADKDGKQYTVNSKDEVTKAEKDKS